MVRGMSPIAKQVFVLLFCLGEGGTPVLPGIKTRWEGDPWKDQPWGTGKEGDPRLGRGPCSSPQGIGTGEGAKSVNLSLRMLMAGCLVWFIGFVKVRHYAVSVQLLPLASKGVCLSTRWGGTPPSGPRSLLFWGGGTTRQNWPLDVWTQRVAKRRHEPMTYLWVDVLTSRDADIALDAQSLS